MIQYLQKLQRKRGFTIIELIVVLAIIGVLTAIIVPGLSGKNEKIRAANMHARDFYSGIQYVMTHFQMTESYVTPEIGFAEKSGTIQGLIKYSQEHGQNVLVYPYTYIYVRVDGNTNLTVNAGRSFTEMIDSAAIANETLFEKALREQLTTVLKADYEGYCYALVYNGGTNANIFTREITGTPQNIRVLSAHFMTDELPAFSGTSDDYINNNLMFSDIGVLLNDSICGTCSSDRNETTNILVGDAGSYFFNIDDVDPDKNDVSALTAAIL